jgi:hypothetical protein
VPLSLTKPGGWFNDESEYRYFSFWNVEFMQLKCSMTYLAAFESDLWSRLVPQVAFEEEFAKHAMIALGAMNKAAEALPAAHEKTFSYNNRHHETALKHQGKVIKLLRQQFESPCLDERNVQTILVACLLLGCFENAHGGVKAILPLFQSGVKVLSDFNENRREQNLVSTSTGLSSKHSLEEILVAVLCFVHGLSANPVFTVIESGLIEMFLHFETYLYTIEGQAIDSRASYRNSDDTRALANMPSEFTTLRQARMYLDLIRRLSFNLFHPGSESILQPGLQSNSDVSHTFEFTSLRGADEWYHRSMLNWQKSFDPLLQSCRATTSDTRFCKAASYLEMKQFMIDLDRPDTLKSYYPNVSVLELCVKVSALASQLLESEDEVLGRGPTMPRYDMLLEEVVSPMFRAADRDGSSVIREMGNGLLHKYSASEELDWIKRLRSKASIT